MRPSHSIAVICLSVIAAVMLGPMTAFGQDVALEAKFSACKQAGDDKCMHRTLRKIMTSPKHVAWCKDGSPEAANGCLIYSVWFYCSAAAAAEASTAEESRDIAERGRETYREVLDIYDDVSPISEMPKNHLVFGNALFDLIEAEACKATGDRPCFRAAAKKVAKADRLGAFEKYAMRQCWPETGGVPKERIRAVVKAAGGNP